MHERKALVVTHLGLGWKLDPFVGCVWPWEALSHLGLGSFSCELATDSHATGRLQDVWNRACEVFSSARHIEGCQSIIALVIIMIISTYYYYNFCFVVITYGWKIWNFNSSLLSRHT